MIKSRLRIAFLAVGFWTAGEPALAQRRGLRARSQQVRAGAAEAGLSSKDWAGIRAALKESHRGSGTVDEGDAQSWDPGGSQTMTSGATFDQQAFLKGHNTDIGDFLGWSVSVSGDTVAVAAPGQDSPVYDAGAAYVFVRSGTSWIQQAYLKASNPGIRDSFGTSVSLSGETLVVGALHEDSSATGVNGDQSNNGTPSSGAAYVFVRSGTTWSQQAYLKASNTDRNDYFGMGVSVSGDTVVVGAPHEDSSATGVNANQSNNSATDSGAAYVFVRIGTSWSQQAYLKASNTQAGDLFGGNAGSYGNWNGGVIVSGDTIVVGAIGEDSNATGVNGNQSDDSTEHAGAAYVFVRTGTNWSQQAYLKASNTNAYDLFSQSVSVSGNTVVAGAPWQSNYQGATYVFERSGTTWSQQGLVQPGGDSVSVAGDTLVVGQPYLSRGNAEVGAAYLFERRGTTWIGPDIVSHSSNWPPERLGYSVSVSCDTAVVGAWGAGPGPSWNPAGAAYVYKVSSGITYPITYCTGKTTSAGCVPFITSAGTPNANTGSFLIRGNNHVEGQPGLMIYSTRKANLDFHGGKLCVRMPFRRVGMIKSTDGIACTTCAGNCRMLEQDFNQLIQAGTDPMLTCGQSVFVQLRQNDLANVGPTGFADNLSDALTFTIAP